VVAVAVEEVMSAAVVVHTSAAEVAVGPSAHPGCPATAVLVAAQ